MSLIRRVARGSLVYTATRFLQKGLSFFLLPLYTRYLAPGDYGILAVVTAINGFLAILLTLGLPGAIIRFYFEYKDHPEKLRSFVGTVLTCTFCVSAAITAPLLLFGPTWLRSVVGDIPFWPYVALGILTTLFQPFFTVYLGLLQAREKARLYSWLSFSQFALTLALVIALVVLARWGASGPLTATLVVSVAFFFLSLYLLRHEVRFGINLSHLGRALRYSLPLVPHSLAGQVSSVTDRLFLNSLLGAASAGLYNIGFTFGWLVMEMAEGVNRAYVPVSMDVLTSRDPQELERLRHIGLLLVVVYCLAGAGVSVFSRELIWVFTASAYHQSYVVVPFVAFTAVLGGIYFLLVNILFYETRATKLVSLGTGLGAAANVVLNWRLIPMFGLMGAAAASFLAQLLGTIFIGLIGRRYEQVRWQYGRFVALLAAAMALSFPFLLAPRWGIGLLLSVKVGVFAVLFVVLSLIAWRNPFYLLQHSRGLVLDLLRSRKAG